MKIIPLGITSAEELAARWDNVRPTTWALQKEIDTWTSKSGTEKRPVMIETLNELVHKINLFPDMSKSRLRGAIALASGTCAEEIELIFGDGAIYCRGVQNTKQEKEEKKIYIDLQEELDKWASEMMSKKIKVIIKMLDGRKRPVNLPSDMTVCHLKKIIWCRQWCVLGS